jgi:hypothetical protein
MPAAFDGFMFLWLTPFLASLFLCLRRFYGFAVSVADAVSRFLSWDDAGIVRFNLKS